MMKPFLFEIGVEEIPASYLAPYIMQLQKLLLDEFKTLNLKHEQLKTAYTPRRLTVYSSGLQVVQPIVEQELKGPPVEIAYKDGVPTKAAQAFADKIKQDVAKLETKKIDGKDYLYAKIKIGGADTKNLLTSSLISIIRKLKSTKSMRWDDKPTIFARPIRSLLCLLGDEVVALDLDGLKSSNTTFGHRFLSKGKIKIDTADWEEYSQKLRNEKVIVDYDERVALIKSKLLAKGASSDKLDQGLIKICANLVEFPEVIRGDFDEKYLRLPEEVLVTTLKMHQKSFTLYDENNKIIAGFLSVVNNDLKNPELIKLGYERVIVARLADAMFFWNEDCSKKLSERTEILKNMIFQKELGTYYDKLIRTLKIAKFINSSNFCKNKLTESDIETVVMLSRSDLVSAMVFEFPELQGIMGAIYARITENIPEKTASAIAEMYMPRSAEDELPNSDLGSLISISDRIDTIVGCCFAGLAPTGSSDPYAIRRHIISVLRIIIANNYDFNLDAVLDFSLNLFKLKSIQIININTIMKY